MVKIDLKKINEVKDRYGFTTKKAFAQGCKVSLPTLLAVERTWKAGKFLNSLVSFLQENGEKVTSKDFVK